MIQVLISGGWMMLPILMCSVIAVAIIFERWQFFRKLGSQDAGRMLQLMTQGKFSDALQLAERHPSALHRILSSGILSRGQDPIKAMEAAGIAEISAMKRGLPALDTIITLAPLLGLLGTIIGMIRSFEIMAESGIGQPHAVTGGVAEALICTAAGIFVAVTTLVPYNYFLARVERYAELIEEHATKAESALGSPSS